MDLLDTDVLIDIQRGHPPALNWFAGVTILPSVPGFVVMELIQSARNSKEVKQAWRMVAPLQIVWPSEVDCQRALTDFAKYHLSSGLGLLDALIASCAVVLSATLCTFNIKHYKHVPGLVVIEPYIR
jgi:predicted nucleic acid-binding protein